MTSILTRREIRTTKTQTQGELMKVDIGRHIYMTRSTKNHKHPSEAKS